MTYWEKRAEDAIARMEETIDNSFPELIESFEQSKRDLQKEINSFYGRYASENKISFVEAQKLLNFNELREFKGNLKAYEVLAKKSIGTYNLQLNNLSTTARITRLQALEFECDTILQRLYQKQKNAIESIVSGIYENQYFHTLFDVEQYTGFQFKFSKPTTSAVAEVLKQPVQGADISTRLWRQDLDTGFKIRQTLNEMFVTGKPPQDFDESLSKIIGNHDKDGNLTGKKYEAYRLLYTESAYASNRANLDAYQSDDIEEYEIISTLDSKTSQVCRNQDGKHYPIVKAIHGENFPPFHVFCRTTTAPYIDIDFKSNRMARDETGKSVPVKSKTYDEWYQDKVKQQGKDAVELEDKKAKNEGSDFRQYEKYKTVLGKYSPNSFAKFQELKYNNSEEWGSLRAQHKGMTYYNNAVLKEPGITKSVVEVGDKVGMKTAGLEYRIKEKESYLRKIRSNYSPNGNEYEINDILCYTYISTPDELANKTLVAIDELRQRGYQTVQIKNTWNSKYNPYKGINTIVQSQNGQKFEVQYHTHESFVLKNGVLHNLYEKARLLESTSQQYIELSQQMTELSSQLTMPKGIERVKKI